MNELGNIDIAYEKIILKIFGCAYTKFLSKKLWLERELGSFQSPDDFEPLVTKTVKLKVMHANGTVQTIATIKVLVSIVGMTLKYIM